MSLITLAEHEKVEVFVCTGVASFIETAGRALPLVNFTLDGVVPSDPRNSNPKITKVVSIW